MWWNSYLVKLSGFISHTIFLDAFPWSFACVHASIPLEPGISKCQHQPIRSCHSQGTECVSYVSSSVHQTHSLVCDVNGASCKNSTGFLPPMGNASTRCYLRFSDHARSSWNHSRTSILLPNSPPPSRYRKKLPENPKMGVSLILDYFQMIASVASQFLFCCYPLTFSTVIKS